MRVLVLLLTIFNVQMALANDSSPDVMDDPAAANQIFTGDAQTKNPFNSTAGTQTWIEEGRARAVSILALAYQEKNNDLLASTYSGLKRAKIITAQAGYDFQACSEGTLAFVMRGGDTIHLCSIVVSLNVRTDVLAEILIHEAAHVAGIYSECTATVVETAAMALSGVGIQFENSYWGPCGLK